MFFKHTFILASIAFLGFSSALFTQNTEEAKDVTDEDLEQFVVIYQQVQTENQKVQQEMVTVIQEEGMEVNRFTELNQAHSDPNQEVEATEEELKAFENINEELQTVQTEFQEKVKKMIEEEGMTLQRYQEVYVALQNDEDLQAKFGEMMNG